MISKLLRKMVAKMPARGMLYKAVVQTIQLYGRKIWVVTVVMLKVLEGLYHQVARTIARMTTRNMEAAVQKLRLNTVGRHTHLQDENFKK